MLKVWIPGTTDARDQGLGGTTWANSGVTIDSSGKLGKCLYSGTSGNMTTSNFSLSTKWSYSCWWKDANTSAGWQYIFLLHNGTQNDTNSQMAFLSYPTQSRCEVCSNGKWYSTQAYTPGTWNHISATYDGTTCKVYFNGIYTTSFTPGQTVIGANLQIFRGANVYLNDLRIWDDEVISPREIKELSKGLVLHYPLSGSGGGCENLMEGSNFGITSGQNTSEVKIATLIPVDTTITVSVQVDADDVVWDSSSNYQRIGTEFWTPKSGTTGNQYLGAWAGQELSSSGNVVEAFTGSFHGRISKTFTTLGEVPALRYVGLYVQGVTSGTVRVSNPKVEIGSVATPWVPNAADTEYAALGFNDGIEYDVSGYGYNGTKTGTFEYDADTPRYNTSTVFSGSNHIAVGRLPITDELTYSWWGYVDDWSGQLGGAMMCSVEGGGMGQQNGGSTGLWFICGTGTTSNNYGSGYQMPIPSAGWHMFTETWDGYRFKVYLDGELKFTDERYTTKTPVYYNAGYNFLFLGGESGASATTPSNHFIGKLSDARVYATALSTDDVMALYHTPISLANNGTLLTQGEYVES